MPQVDSNEIPFNRSGRGQRASGANASPEARLNDIVADISEPGDSAGRGINLPRQDSGAGKYVFIFLSLVLIPGVVYLLLSWDFSTVSSDKKVVASVQQVIPPAPAQTLWMPAGGKSARIPIPIGTRAVITGSKFSIHNVYPDGHECINKPCPDAPLIEAYLTNEDMENSNTVSYYYIPITQNQSQPTTPPQSAPVYLFQNTLPGTYNMGQERNQKQNEVSPESSPQPLPQQQEPPLTITSEDALDFGVIKMRNKDGRLMFNPMQRSFVFNNPNNRKMTIKNISNPEYPFSIINNCPTVMEPILSCNILVKFEPNRLQFDADIDETEETYKGKMVINTEGGDMIVTLLGKSSLVVERRIENRFDNRFKNRYARNSYGRRY